MSNVSLRDIADLKGRRSAPADAGGGKRGFSSCAIIAHEQAVKAVSKQPLSFMMIDRMLDPPRRLRSFKNAVAKERDAVPRIPPWSYNGVSDFYH